MIAVLAVAVTAAASPQLDLAYCARYYFQGRRHSFHQIYLVNHTGKGKRQVTRNEFDSYAPLWVDRNHLAWVEAYARVASNVEAMEPTYRLRVMLLDLGSWKKRDIGHVTSEIPYFGIWATGNTFELNKSGPNSTEIPTTYKVTRTGIVKVANKESRMMDEQFGDDDYTGMGDSLGGEGKVMLKTKFGDWTLHWTGHSPNMISEDDKIVAQNWVEMKSTWKGKTKTFRLHGNHVVNAAIDASGTPIIQTCYALEKYRHDDYVYRLSRDFKRIAQVSGKVGLVHLHPERHLWIGHQVGLKEGAMENLDDGRGVYVFWLYAGDYRKGKQWTIADGLVQVTGEEFRPLR